MGNNLSIHRVLTTTCNRIFLHLLAIEGKNFNTKETFLLIKKKNESCDQEFNSYQDLKNHQQRGGRAPVTVEDISPRASTSNKRENNVSLPNFDRRSALNDTAQEITIRPENEVEKYDLLHFYSAYKPKVMSLISEQGGKLGNVKFYLNTRVRMVRHLEGGVETTIPHFRSRTCQVLNDGDVDHFLNEAFQQMQNAMQEFVHRGSDWVMDRVIGLEVKIVPYQPLTAAKYNSLPPNINNLKGIINIQNDYEKCFVWCVLAALHPAEKIVKEFVNIFLKKMNSIWMVSPFRHPFRR